MRSLGVVVMASGFSRRFGPMNKLTMPFGDSSIIETTISTIIQSGISKSIVLVTQHQEVADLYRGNNQLQVVMNNKAYKGLSQSIKLGIKALPNSDAYMFMPGDQVGISCEALVELANAYQGQSDHIIVPVYGKTYGSPKIFPSSLRVPLLALEGDEGGRSLIRIYKDRLKEIAIDHKEANMDIDTLQTYLKHRKGFE